MNRRSKVVLVVPVAILLLLAWYIMSPQVIARAGPGAGQTTYADPTYSRWMVYTAPGPGGTGSGWTFFDQGVTAPVNCQYLSSNTFAGLSALLQQGCANAYDAYWVRSVGNNYNLWGL
jgi:hypothetical protein